MSKANPGTTITLEVDLTNPGQFLACCGLLELASCLNPDALGHFSPSQFHVAGAASDLLEQFVKCKVTAAPGKKSLVEGSDSDGDSDGKEEKSPPIVLGDPFHLRLDWWEDEAASEAGFKTWSAGMTIPGFFNGTTTGKGEKQKVGPSMRQHLARYLGAGVNLLQSTGAIEKPSPFNFDGRVSRNVAVDLGFVGKVTFAFSPAVELLALVGLQRFRPSVKTRWERNTYHTWHEPLPVNIAAATAHGLIPNLSAGIYVFRVKPRDAQGRYKAFGNAHLERTAHV